jgi:sec-independent protein translocase protein TatB
MLGIDFSEILLIFGIALVVLGPEKLPKLANTIGRWIGRARGMARQFREQLEQETQTLHQGMDLGPEFSSRPGARPGNGGTAPRPTADSSTASASEASPPPGASQTVPRTEPRIDPSAVGPPAPLRATPATGSEPTAMSGPPLPEMGLADTHPAAFRPYQPPPITAPPPLPPGASAAPGPAAPPASTSTTAPSQGAGAAGEAGAPDASFPAPHQTAFWPPDGVL